MTLHTGERWAQEAGDEPDYMRWCRACATWVVPEYDMDEERRYCEWCPMCGGDVVTEEEG